MLKIAYMVENGMSIKREKNNLTFPQNITTFERVAKLRKSSFVTRFSQFYNAMKECVAYQRKSNL